METFDQILLTLVVMSLFGIFFALRCVWNMLSLRSAGGPIPPLTKTCPNVGSLEALCCKPGKLYFTNHGGKCHLFEDCRHIKGKDVFHRDGVCQTCSDRFAASKTK